MATAKNFKNTIRDRIFSANDIKEENLHIPEWDVDIIVRALNGKQRARLLQSALKKDGTPDLEKMYPALTILCSYYVDEDTQEKRPVFEDADRDAIGEKSGHALELIAQVAMRISGLTENALKEAKNE
jgi:hypothetical protein